MSVLECTCGMVMSVSAADPRNTCIRCGRGELRMFERSVQLVDRRERHFDELKKVLRYASIPERI